MKKMMMVVLVILLVFVGCKEVDTTPEDTTTIDNEEEVETDITTVEINENEEVVDKSNVITEILDKNEVKVDKELIEVLYDYYIENPYELSMLPEFDDNKKPEESNLATYIYLNTKQSEENLEKDFIETFYELFGDVDSEE